LSKNDGMKAVAVVGLLEKHLESFNFLAVTIIGYGVNDVGGYLVNLP